jgi:hypothetical protein
MALQIERRSLSRVMSILGFFVNAVFLLAYHVYAEDTNEDEKNSTLFGRLRQGGPAALTTLDLILCGVLVLLGFELLDYISQHSGGRLPLTLCKFLVDFLLFSSPISF